VLAEPVRIKIALFDPKAATREEWERFHVYRRERHMKMRPDDPVTDDATFEAMLTRGDPDSEELRFVGFDTARPHVLVSSLLFETIRPESPSYKGNEHIAWIGLSVRAPNRRQGLGRAMLAKVAELAGEREKTTIQGSSEEEDGKAFLRAVGAQVAQRGLENRLYFDEVDWPMLDSWVAGGAARNPNTSLRWCLGRIDDDILVPFCTTLTEVFNQQPFGEMERGDFIFTPEVVRTRQNSFGEVGGKVVTVMSQEPDGDVSGLTEMGYLPSDGPIIHQWMTGVRRTNMRRGIGKWLKAAMLLRVRRDFPHVRIVTTGNATTNEAMLSINNRLGFRVYRERIGAQMKLSVLEAYLRIKVSSP